MPLKTVKTAHQNEPVLFWTILAAIFNGIQLVTLPVAPWLHVTIIVVAHLASALAARRQVTPVASKS